MSKRSAGDGGATSAAPPSKKASVVQFEPIRIQSATVDEMDMKTLQFQNKRLSERIVDRRKAEAEMRNKIEQLEQRLTADDAVLLVVNRYWNQLDENIRVMLERFDVDSSDTDAVYNESEPLKSFLNQLSSVDSEEMTDKLKQRVEFSKWAVGKLLQAHDRHLWRYERLVQSFKKKPSDEESGEKQEEEISEQKQHDEEKQRLIQEVEVLKAELSCVQKENTRLQALVTGLHERHHSITLSHGELQDRAGAEETRNAELQNTVSELQWQLEQTQQRSLKLEHALADAAQQKKSASEAAARLDVSGGVRKEDGDSELEELRELAESRLVELERVQREHQDKIREVEQLKQDLKTLPACIITESPEYKCLQSQFSVLYNEATLQRSQLNEKRLELQNSRTEHLQQIHSMELGELEAQKKLKAELTRSEATIAELRREYESLRVEFEQLLAANEQTGPINREMRQLITNLQTTNKQHKLEINRYRRKTKEATAEIMKLKAEQDREALQAIKKDADCGACSEPEVKKPDEKEEGEIKDEPKVKQEPMTAAAKERRDIKEVKEEGKTDSDTERRLRAELKKAQDSHKEVKLLLDMYKSAPKEQRERAEMLAQEKRLKAEVEDLKKIVRRLEGEKSDLEKRERRQIAETEAPAKLKKMEEINNDLHKRLASQKQGEEAILKELEVTGQAYEELEEQNARLLQQLREKDDANFKLLSDRVKSSQVVKILKEEKEVLGEQLSRHLQQRAAQQQVIADLEETDRTLRTALAHQEHEVMQRQQSLDQYKRKAVESAQAAADLKLHADKYHSQLREAQTALQDKTAAVQQEGYKYRRLQEEMSGVQRRLERAQKIQAAQSADEVLLEEIREYKEQLTCPSCKVKRKDAVLTKCFHVFCLECLKTRYETRQRKCPKCNAGFGANDYRRLYLD